MIWKLQLVVSPAKTSEVEHMRARKAKQAAEITDFSFGCARLIAAELNGTLVPAAGRPLIYMAEDTGDGRARVAALQHGELAFYL